MYRKILSLAMTLIPYSRKFEKGLLIMIVILVSLAVHSRNMPFIINEFNLVELKSMIVALLTIFFGILRSTNILHDFLSFLLFLLIIIALMLIFFWAVCQLLSK